MPSTADRLCDLLSTCGQHISKLMLPLAWKLPDCMIHPAKCRKWLQWEARFFSSFIQLRQTPKVQVNNAVVVSFFFISIFFIEYARIADDKGILRAANLLCKKTHFGLIKCSIFCQATVPTSTLALARQAKACKSAQQILLRALMMHAHKQDTKCATISQCKS